MTTKIGNSLGNNNSQGLSITDTLHQSFSSPVIDSTKIRIPLDKVQIIDSRLGAHLITVNVDTGETVDEDFKSKSLYIEYNGIKTKYVIENQVTKEQTVKQYLTFLISSKLLEKDYFQGIDSTTIGRVYSAIISQNVVIFSFNDFLASEITDTDIKIDGICNRPVIDIIRQLESSSQPKKKAVEGMSCYKKKDNLGIGYALRKTQSFKRAPYLKLYEKVRELQYNSTSFYNSFIKGNIELPKELLRIETTIKNRKHYKQLGLSNNVLSLVLDNLRSLAHSAFQNAFSVHINSVISYVSRLSSMSKKLNVNDRILVLHLISLVDSGLSFDSSINQVVESVCFDKSERYKLRKRISSLVSKCGIEGVSKDDNHNHFYEFLKSV